MKRTRVMLAVFVALLWLAGGFIVGLFSVIGGEYNSQANEAFLGMLILTAGLVAALAIANIINAVVMIKKVREGDILPSVSAAAFWTKIAAIPFFVVNFVFWVAVSAAFFAVPGLQLFLLTITPLSIVFAYIDMLASSAYCMAVAGALASNGIISRKAAVINIILQFIFGLDVFSALYIHVKAKKLRAPCGETAAD